MQLLKTAAVLILFLLIPHQAPLAGSAEEPGAAVPADQALAGAVDDGSPARVEPAGRDALAEDAGFVWSEPAVVGAGEAWVSSFENLQIDGYSWSARSGGPDPAPDSNF